MVTHVKSLENAGLEIGICWHAERKMPQEPACPPGTLKFVDCEGTIADCFLLHWNHHELLPFDTYSHDDIQRPKIVLRGVKVSRA
jgi:hypothetical protein